MTSFKFGWRSKTPPNMSCHIGRRGDTSAKKSAVNTSFLNRVTRSSVDPPDRSTSDLTLRDLREELPLLLAETGVDEQRQAAVFADASRPAPRTSSNSGTLAGVAQEAGRVRPAESVIGQPLELGHRGGDIDTRTAGANEEHPVLDVTERVVQPAVVGPHAGLAHLVVVSAVEDVVEDGRRSVVAEVDELPGNALAVHLAQPDLGIPDAPIPTFSWAPSRS